jgi:hypothetical protein
LRTLTRDIVNVNCLTHKKYENDTTIWKVFVEVPLNNCFYDNFLRCCFSVFNCSPFSAQRKDANAIQVQLSNFFNSHEMTVKTREKKSSRAKICYRKKMFLGKRSKTWDDCYSRRFKRVTRPHCSAHREIGIDFNFCQNCCLLHIFSLFHYEYHLRLVQ